MMSFSLCESKYVNDCGHFTSVTQRSAVEISDYRKENDCVVIAVFIMPWHYLYQCPRPSTKVGMGQQLTQGGAAVIRHQSHLVIDCILTMTKYLDYLHLSSYVVECLYCLVYLKCSFRVTLKWPGIFRWSTAKRDAFSINTFYWNWKKYHLRKLWRIWVLKLDHQGEWQTTLTD